MRRFLKFVPVSLTFFLIIGILIANSYQFSVKSVGLAAIACMFLFSLIYYFTEKQKKTTYFFIFGFFMASFFLGVSSLVFKNELNNKKHYSLSNGFSKNDKTPIAFWIVKKLKSTTNYYKYEAEIVAVSNKKASGKILLQIKRDSIATEFEIGSNFFLNAAVVEIPDPKNPFGFDYKKYLKSQQIHHQVVDEFSNLTSLNYTNRSIMAFAGKLRQNSIKKLSESGFKNDELAVISALLLGEKTTISSELLADYSKAGAIHILAVSGLHVGLILLILSFMFRPLHAFKNGKTYSLIAVVLLLWMFALIAGLSASVVRAVTMFSALAIGMQLNRPTNVYNTLVVSMFCLLVFNPYYLFEIGFQMSYLAVFSIVWIQPKLYELWYPKFWLMKKGWQLLTVSFAAQLGVLPLSLFYFHQFPGLFFISNLVIIPFLGFILGFGILVIVLSLLNILPTWLGEILIIVIQKMNLFIEWVASHEQFIISSISISLTITLVSYLILISFFKWSENKNRLRFLIVCFSVLFFQAVLFYEKYQLQTTKELIVFNNSRNSLLVLRNGEKIQLMCSDSTLKKSYELDSYLLGKGIKKVDDLLPIYESFSFGKSNFEVLSESNFKITNGLSKIVILQNSPKINLERFLLENNPKLIIADGSNYGSYIKNWEQTCLKNKTPFYSTMQKGAFIINE